MSDAPSRGELILYRTEDGREAIRLRVVDGTVWLTQAEMATLFITPKQNASLHLKNVFETSELLRDSVVRESLTTATDGKAYPTSLYNLDAILAVGYRVGGPRGSQFRRWTTTVLREFLIKGFLLDDGGLKEPGGFDYFDELARIRDIRASEKRFYQKVRDLFKASSVDGERVRKTDVTVSKNYLDTPEIESLNRLTTMFLDFAEERASRRQEIRMAEWIAQTDRFLAFNERDVLQGKGRMAHERMTEIVHSRFEVFDAHRRAAEAVEAVEAEQEADEDLAKLEAEARRLTKGKQEKAPAEDKANIDDLRRQMKDKQDRLERKKNEPKKDE